MPTTYIRPIYPYYIDLPSELPKQPKEVHFTPGTKVYWYSEPRNRRYYGTIVKETEVFFGKDSSFYQDYNMETYIFTDISSIHIALSKEEAIKERIHKLWNESNWVKKNPQYAY